MLSPEGRAVACVPGIVVFSLCLTVVCSGSAQTFPSAPRGGRDAETPLVVNLLPKEESDIHAPPPLLIVSGASCDPEGNIYLIYSDAPLAVLTQPSGKGIVSLPVQKINMSSKRTIQYPVPSVPGFQDPRRYHFFVDAYGKVYALFSVKAGASAEDDLPTAYIIVKYRDDGQLDSYVKLNTGDRKLQPIQFAVFRDGTFLVSGAALQAQEPIAFTAVFDRHGAWVKEVKDVVGGQARASSARQPSLTVGSGFVLIGPDGNAYMLRASDPPWLYAVSPEGDVLNRGEVDPPSPGLAPLEMGKAGRSHIFIQFGSIRGSAPVEGQPDEHPVVVVDLNTLRADAVYRLSMKDGGSPTVACASSPQSFSVVGVGADNKLSVTRYGP